ncbi:hypothetical protein, partial [Streptococcus pneumoniae]|uniref:hypothetical protein n=1 Tax=Streptococcus pneumoniae TaxID=1313 RepID=UPI0018B0793C
FADVSLIAGCFMRMLEAGKIWNFQPQVPPTREELLAKYTEQELHDKEMHPDWEYETTETGRKSGESKRPEGDGWVE